VHGVVQVPAAGALQPEFELYATPVNSTRSYPAMPRRLSGRYPHVPGEAAGAFRQRSLAEDTWGFHEHVLGDDHFLQQCLDFDREREAISSMAWIRCSAACASAVFDGSDRHAAHVLALPTTPEHPARPRKCPASIATRLKDLYRRMDDLVGRTLAKCDGQGTC